MQTKSHTNQRTGYLYVVMAALLFGISGTAAKSLFNSGLTAFQLIQMRTTLASLGLLIWMVWRRPALLRVTFKSLPYFFSIGVFGIGAAQFFYLLAISKINVAAAILLHYTGPVFVAMYVVLVQNKRIGLQSILAIIGSLIGCFLVVGAYDLHLFALSRDGILAGVLAAMAFAVYSLLSAHGMQTYSPWTVLMYGMLFAAIMWNTLHPPLEAFFHHYTPIQWGWVLFIGFFGTIVPFGLYFEGIKRIQPTHASITATLEPISAGVMATIFLGEVMTPLQMLGGLIVIGAITLLQLSANDYRNGN